MNKTNTTLKCSSTHGKSINKAKELPQRIHEKHKGKIQLAENAVYTNANTPIEVICSVCNHHWKPTPSQLTNKKRGCPACDIERKRNYTGVRQIRGTSEEKEKAILLRSEGLSYENIAIEMGRSSATIAKWTDETFRQKCNDYALNYVRENRTHVQETQRRYYKSEHGKTISTKNGNRRRSLKWHTLDYIHLPENADADKQGFVEVDNFELIETAADREFFSFEGADEDIAKRKIQQEKLSKISGEKYSLEHLVPLSKGGVHCPENFANRSLELNIKKHNKRIKEDEELFCKRLFNIK